MTVVKGDSSKGVGEGVGGRGGRSGEGIIHPQAVQLGYRFIISVTELYS